ncbi:MAG: hypothetical protein ACE5H7_16800 [Acidiferrobacterales bacterium]
MNSQKRKKKEAKKKEKMYGYGDVFGVQKAGALRPLKGGLT